MSHRHTPNDDVIRDPLPGLRDQLMSEYGGVASLERIDEAAEHALAELDGARIRDFVPVFAWRRAREHLRKAA